MSEEPKPRITKEYRDQVFKPTHLGLKRYGFIPTSRIADMPGASGEVPLRHARGLPNKYPGHRWEEFKSDIRENGIKHGIFITHEVGKRPVISEGNHRRGAALELGLPEVPVEVNYIGQHEEHDELFRDRRP